MKKTGGSRAYRELGNGMTVEPTCKTQERAKLLVLQSRTLIETASSLITDARQLVAQARAKKK